MCMGKTAKEDPVLLEDPPFTSLQIHVKKQIGNMLKMWVCVVSVKSKQSHNIFLNKFNILFYNEKLDKRDHKTNEQSKMGSQNATGALISKSTLQYSYLNSLPQK